MGILLWLWVAHTVTLWRYKVKVSAPGEGLTLVSVGRYLGFVTPITLRVRELRDARGWSLRELARRANVRPNTLSAIENGQTKGVDFETLEKLANALEVDAGYLIVKRGR